VLVNSVLVPVVLFPLLLWLVFSGMALVRAGTEGQASRIALDNAPPGQGLLWSRLKADPHIAVVQTAEARQALALGSLDAVVEFLPPAERALPDSYRARIVFDGARDGSALARARLTEILGSQRERQIGSRLRELRVSQSIFQPYEVEIVNVASPLDMGRFFLRLWLPLLVVVMVALGTLYPALEATAGERERSTFETLLVLPTARKNVVVAKYLCVATLSASAGLLNLAAVMLSLGSVLAPMLRGNTPSFRLPLASLPVIVASVLLLALFVSAAMMIPAAFARSFREGQALATPFLIVVFIPAQLFNLPNVKFTPAMACVPIGNVVLLLRDAVSGTYQWPQIAITLSVECVCVVAALALAVRILRDEELVSGTYSGRLGAFLRERLFQAAR
jgi:sodium transport system permease protein